MTDIRKAHHQALRLAAMLVALSLFVISGCGPGPAPENWGRADDHFDILIGSTASGGGALVADYDFSEEVAVGAPQCIGGSGATCAGGVVLRSAEAPGFSPQEVADPEAGIFPLVEGVQVRLVRTDGSPEASLFIAGTSLSAVGDSVVLGQALEALHVHGDWQIILPGGQEPAGDYFIALKLTADAERYAESEEFVIVLHADDDEHDDHEHD